MKRYVYPAVLYTSTDADEYMLNIEDLGIFSYGATIEKVSESSQDALCAYVRCCLKFDAELPDASSFADMEDKYPNKKVMLIEAWFDENNMPVRERA